MKTNLKRLAVALSLTLVAIAAASPGAAPQITHTSVSLIAAGFEAVTTFDGWLDDDETETYSIWLQRGAEYAFSGRCDNDCSDLDLRLRNRQGHVVAESTDGSDFPVIRFTPSSSGTYQLAVEMYRCRIEPCSYAVDQLRR